jgi:hypothetical protein
MEYHSTEVIDFFLKVIETIDDLNNRFIRPFLADWAYSLPGIQLRRIRCPLLESHFSISLTRVIC